MGYEKNRFVDNVYSLARLRHIRIGELEKQCGVSAGYFARLRQGEKNIAPGAESLLRVSDLLSVSVDSLLRDDFARATGSELEVLLFIDKLIRETDARELSWLEDLAAYPGAVPINLDGSVLHPLYTSCTNPADGFCYHSMFRLMPIDLIPVKAFCCSFPGERSLYIVQVRYDPEDADTSGSWTELDLVIVGHGILDPIPIGHTNHERPGRLDGAMNRLLAAAEDASVLPKLRPEAREIISEYLNTERSQIIEQD